jgi:hypothetical protein
MCFLQSASTPAEQQVDDYESEDEAEASTPVVPKAGAHVVSPAAK